MSNINPNTTQELHKRLDRDRRRHWDRPFEPEWLRCGSLYNALEVVGDPDLGEGVRVGRRCRGECAADAFDDR